MEDLMAGVTSIAVAHKQLRSASGANETVPPSLPRSEPAPPLAAKLDQFIGDPNFMTSLARGLTVIQAFSPQSLHLSISQLSKRTGLPRASVRRCLHTLSKLGFAGSDDGRTFYLLSRVLPLGHSYLSSLPLSTVAQPVLERLSHILHESSSIAILDGIEIVYVARANVTRIVAIDLGVGTRLPAFCTSIGRVLLANLPAEEMEALLPRIEFSPYTDRTLTSVEQLRRALLSVRRDGYAIVDEELEVGLRSMAVPVQNSTGRVLAAINSGVNGQRVSVQDMQTRFLPYLRAAAQELCLLLG
jgi:IclR family transcriptional regulator, pca regulon regulatory protein